MVRRGRARSRLRPRELGGLWHGPVRPEATYSPWFGDSSFLEIEASIQGFTLVDRYRLWELWELVEQVAQLPDGDILELGVWRGGTGALMACRARSLGLETSVVLCDTFAGVVKTGDKDPGYQGGEHSDASAADVEELIARLELDGVEILAGIFPDDTGHAIADRRFRLCHFDLDAYVSTSDAFDWVWPRLLPGGVAVFDDYGFPSTGGVTTFVEEQRREPGRTVIHNLNGHAVIVKHG
jgi:O-methyltransferase